MLLGGYNASARLARLVCGRPRLVLAVATLLAAVAIAYTVSSLSFQPNRNDLLAKDLEWNQRAIAWWDRFPAMTVATVVVDTEVGGQRTDDTIARAEDMARELAERLGASPSVRRIDWGAPEREFAAGALRLAPPDEFERAIEAIRRSASSLLVGRTPSEAMASATGGLRAGGADADPGELDQLTAFVAAIGRAAEEPEQAAEHLGALAGPPADAWRPLTTPNGRFLVLRATPAAEGDKLNAPARAIAEMRRVIAEASATDPEVRVGLTGVDVVEADETSLATVDSAIASTIAAVVITTMLIVAFFGWRKPALAMAALLFGIAWSFGYLTLTIGHLQVLSVVFVVILLGIGIDFGIHFATTLEEYRHHHQDEEFEPAIAATIRSAGPGITAGGVTTAAAFLVTTVTDFRGVAEMGLIAAGGILLCLVAMFTVYPSLLALIAPRRRHIKPLEERAFHLFRPEWFVGMTARPALSIGIALGATIVAGVLALGTRFDSDLLAFQPRSLPSVAWQRTLAEEGDASVWFAVSITDDLDEARRRAALFREQDTVSGVGGVALLFPPDEAERIGRIARLRGELAPALQPDNAEGPDMDPELGPRLASLASLAMSAASGEDVPDPWRLALRRLAAEASTAAGALGRGGADAERAVVRGFGAMRAELRGRLAEALGAEPLTIDDLPEAVMAPYIDRSDPDAPRYAVEIYPRLERPGFDSPLESAFLKRFVGDLTSIDPEATGVPFQIYYSSGIIRESFVWAGGAALVIVLVIVYLMFRSVADALIAVVPVVMGFVLTLGVMRLIGQPINLANIIVLPLLFGIGVDNGIHMLHRYHLNPHERPLGLTHGTGKGIALTSLTTMAGFATMMVSRHKGIAGLGMTLAIGIGLTLVTCLLVLPAWFEWRQRTSPRRAPLDGDGTRVRSLSPPTAPRASSASR